MRKPVKNKLLNLIILHITKLNFMKKAFVLIVLFTILSCSNSDNDSNTNTDGFNPPAWIQGTWKNSDTQGGFSFSSDNVCSVSPSMQICYKETLANYNKAGLTTSINESINSQTEYKFSYTVQGGLTVEYHLKKGTADNVIYFVSVSGEIPLTKQ